MRRPTAAAARIAPPAALLLAALLLVGCGGPPHIAGHACDPTKPTYVQQCKSAVGQHQYKLAAPGPGPRSGLLRARNGVFGVDFAWGGPSGSAARAFGAHYGISYLSGTSKDWTYSRAHSFTAAGLGVVFVFETIAARSLSGCSGGSYDAQRAAGEEASLGYAGAPVYFATDFDTTGFALHGSVGEYYRCAGRALGGGRAGAYGGLRTMAIAAANGVRRLWQTIAWSYGAVAPGVCLYQSGVDWSWHGYSVDPDLAFCADYGQAGYRKPPPRPPRLVCFGPRARTSSARCRAIRADVARWTRARDASARAYTHLGCPVLAQRDRYFSGRLRHPSSRAAHQRAALAATRRIEARRHCSTFPAREAYFARLAATAVKSYS